MGVTIVRVAKGIRAPALPHGCYRRIHVSGVANHARVSRRLVAAFLNISPETVSKLGIQVANGGGQGERTWYRQADVLEFLEFLEEGLSGTWPSQCLIKPESVALYLGTSPTGLRMMRYRGKGPSCIKLTPRLIRFSKSSVDKYECKITKGFRSF